MSIQYSCPRQVFPNPSNTYLINYSPRTQIGVRYKRVNNTATTRCQLSQQGSGAGKLVCVTGASGFLASWLVRTLLQRGYHVNATYRDDRSKCEHLEGLDGAEERLHLLKANLLEDGSFNSCVDGCEGVFHTASPFSNDFKDPKKDLKPAVDGTLNVLGSVARTSSVKRVVLTSSIAAVNYNYMPKGPDVVVDETWFSDQNFCTKYKKWYALSKTRAEEEAWSFVKVKGIDMVSINPATILGPLLQPKVNLSVGVIRDLIHGGTTYQNEAFGWVHVKDVVEAHILALENQTANGRYCVVESVAHYKEIVGILRDLYPELLLPDKCADGNPLKPIYQVSKKRTKSLGVINYIPLKDALKDTVESLREKKFVTF